MTASLTHHGRTVAKRLIAYQVLVAVVVSLGFLAKDFNAAYSSLLGGLICIIPNMIFALYATRFGGARAAKQIARSFYLGETLKFVLTVVLFTVTFKFLTISVGPLFICYVLTLMVFWFSPLLLKR